MQRPAPTAPTLSRRTALTGLLAGGLALALPGRRAAAAADGVAAVLLSRIDDERRRHGLPPLPEDPQLSAVAHAWSGRMAGGVGLRHNPDAEAQYGWPVDRAGEVVAYAANPVRSAEELAAEIVGSWMASSGHRAIILGSGWTDIGVGWGLGAGGRLYATANVITAPLPAAAREAVTVSQELIGAGSAPRVVITRGDDPVDALAGSALAGADCPILFTRAGRPLGDLVLGEVARAAAPGGQVHLLGGALPGEVADQVRGLGLTAVPVAGGSRYATAAAVAREVVRSRQRPGRAYLVRADAWADAVSIAGPAALAGAPVLLVDRDHVPHETAAALADLGDVERIVVGGAGAIAESVVSALRAYRVAGPDRASTGAVVMREVWSRHRAAVGDHLVVTPGWAGDGWVTALAHATYGARHGAPLLFSSGAVPPPVRDALVQTGYSAATAATVRFSRGVPQAARQEYLALTGH
ncbi:cell wall-binding repeat-containing protein [Euzebya sp.]|uniref:cell wall-binding repeat-containing protein n=1 Tax=Euzebya sp. TaxID=1971409 RepID=UPI003513335C